MRNEDQPVVEPVIGEPVVSPAHRMRLWREANRARYNAYQKEWMRKKRAK